MAVKNSKLVWNGWCLFSRTYRRRVNWWTGMP